MTQRDGKTLELLRRWNGGDQDALGALLEHHLQWITDYVHGRLGAKLRSRAETQDFVQASMLEFLRYGPKFEVTDESAFRGLLARVAENNIRDQNRYLGREKRDQDRERLASSDSILDLDARRDVTRPSQHAQRDESVALIRVALELLDPQDREVVRMREVDELPFAEIGARMEVSEDAARMRFGRALPKLAEKVAQLRERGLASTLSQAPAPPDEWAAP